MSALLTALPAFQDNYIWGLSLDGQALLVDPGDATMADDWLAREGLALAAILVTHHHADHTAGLAALRQGHPEAPVFGPDEDIAGLDHLLAGGETLDLPPFGTVRVLPVPGHTRHHLAFHLPAERLLFCGDALFSAGCGRLFEGSPADLQASLDTLAALPPATRICCAHEYTLANLRFAAAVEPSNLRLAARERQALELRERGLPTLPVTLGEELGYNPFLRTREPAVVTRASLEAGQDLTPGQAVMAVLRRWKDVF